MKSYKNRPEILLWRVNAVKGNSWRLLKALIRGKKQQTVLIGSADRCLRFSHPLPAAQSQPQRLMLLWDPQTRSTAAKLRCSSGHLVGRPVTSWKHLSTETEHREQNEYCTYGGNLGKTLRVHKRFSLLTTAQQPVTEKCTFLFLYLTP